MANRPHHHLHHALSPLASCWPHPVGRVRYQDRTHTPRDRSGFASSGRKVDKMNNTGQAEEVQHTVHLNINRNWIHEDDGSFYDRKVFFLKDGRIGMEHGGRVIVTSIEAWMSSWKEANEQP